MNQLVRFLCRIAKPYRKGHIYGNDDSLYMGRYSLFETRWLSARLHYIVRADLDRHLHDHPWSFLSVVLQGGYTEARPAELEPCFAGQGEEVATEAARRAGSFAFRRATDRHRISAVEPNTWSLFVYGPERQWWGFYTLSGKIHWRDYLNAGRER